MYTDLFSDRSYSSLVCRMRMAVSILFEFLCKSPCTKQTKSLNHSNVVYIFKARQKFKIGSIILLVI